MMPTWIQQMTARWVRRMTPSEGWDRQGCAVSHGSSAAGGVTIKRVASSRYQQRSRGTLYRRGFFRVLHASGTLQRRTQLFSVGGTHGNMV